MANDAFQDPKDANRGTKSVVVGDSSGARIESNHDRSAGSESGRSESAIVPCGRVALVGAGPGHPGLLTLRGLELLQRCDVVLYDGLCNPQLLRHAEQAEHCCVGKHGQSRIWKQTEIGEEMIRHARAGRLVVRLKGGDPAVFARTSEEVAALRSENIPFEIVPGITAALAAGSYAGIPITHRGIASAVALVTGHEQPDKPEAALNWEALAQFPGTLVIYMGVTTAEKWTSALLQAGKDPATPCAILRRCSLPGQQHVACRLDEVAERLTPATKMRPPVITIVGPVTRLAKEYDWFSRRPLSGRRVLVTRPAEQANDLATPLEEVGCEVFIQPVIEVAAPDDWSQVDDAIQQIAEYRTIVFCSRNGVRFFLQRMLQQGRDLRALAGLQIAVVGASTADELAKWHLRADIIPSSYDADVLAEELIRRQALPKVDSSGIVEVPTATVAAEETSPAVLIVRASRGRDSLATPLQDAGFRIHEVIAYEHRDVQEADPACIQQLADHGVDWVTVTSTATAQQLTQLIGDYLEHARFAAISPRTAEALRQLGWRVDAVAEPYTMDGLVQAVLQAEAATVQSAESSRPDSIHPRFSEKR